MEPILVKDFLKVPGMANLYDYLFQNVPWVNRDAPRDECFMASEELLYTYGSGGYYRTYKSVPLDHYVSLIMKGLNAEYLCNYNVCFLNYYKDEKNHLGWHSDNSPEMDINHPIAVISFGAESYIWTKVIGTKGEVPDKDRYLLINGSLFIMPAGYQNEHLHRIPKNDRPCGGRISLTFRKFMNKETV